MPGYGAYPQLDYGAQPAPYGTPQYGMPQPAAAVGGYQAPEPYYPSAGAPPAPGGVAGLTAGLSAMNLGPGEKQQPQQLPPQQRAGPLNQLYPTDLLNQPFNVSELDLPPPPIILPPNVRCCCCWLPCRFPPFPSGLTAEWCPTDADVPRYSRASPRLRMRIAYPSTCARL